MSFSVPGLELRNSHRLFLQAMMWKRICDSGEIMKIFKQCLEQSEVPLPGPDQMSEALYDLVSVINVAIKPINLSIVKCVDEVSGKPYYALINGNDNNISHMSTEYLPAELEYFKRIIESIVCSSNGHVSSTTALNLTNTMDKPMNKVVAQETINKFLRDKWLCQKNGILYLSPRCIAELDYFLTNNYPDDVVKCHLCQKTVIQAVGCAVCKVKVHRHCIRKFLNEQNCCPSCCKKWKEHSGSGGEMEEEEIASSSTRGRKRPHE